MPNTNPLFTFTHVITEDDLDNNPELVSQGYNVGDEVQLTSAEIGPRPGDKNKA